MQPASQQTVPRRALPVRGYLYIAAATFFWAISATMGKAAFTGRLRFHDQTIAPIDPVILSQARTTLSFLLLFVILSARRGMKALVISVSDFWRMALLGVLGLAASNYLYYLAIQKTSVAAAITVQYTAPIWVLLYIGVKSRQIPSLLKLSAVVIAVIGIGTAIGAFGRSTPNLNSHGVIAALLAAFAFAFYNIAGHDILGRRDHWIVLLYLTLTASLFWLTINPPWKLIAYRYSVGQAAFLAVFSLVSMLIPFSFYFAGLRHLEPTRAVVTSCLEPIFSILIANTVLSEIVRPVQLVGMFLVLMAVVIVQLPDKAPTKVVVIDHV